MRTRPPKQVLAESVVAHEAPTEPAFRPSLRHRARQLMQNLNETIDLTLAGIRISFQKALSLHQSSRDEVAHNLGELARRIDSVATIRDELSAYNSAIE